MKLGTFTFPNEPETLRIQHQRNVKVETSKEGSWVVTDSGAEGRTFDCEGVFYGEASYQACKTLASIFTDGKSITLTHSLWGDAKVLMTQLEIEEGCKTNLLRYRMQLVETP